MSQLVTLNLLGVFDFYLIVTFVLGTLMRYRQYRAMLGFIFALSSRWPKLVELAKSHRTLFLAWPTLLPIAVTFGLMLINTLAYNFVWTDARVTPGDLWRHWFSLICVLVFGLSMLALDANATFNIAPFDRAALEKHLDQAEYWMRSWTAPALKILTFGWVNPRKMVNEEVRKALVQASHDLNRMMWWWSLQVAMRLVVGLTLWLTWAAALRDGQADP